MFHPRYEVELNAPIDDAWSLLIGFEAYPSWNSLLSFKQKPEQGITVPMKVVLNGRTQVTNIDILKIEASETRKELRWVGGIKGLIRGEHYFILQKNTEHSCTLIQGEKFRGLLVPVLWPVLAKVLDRLYTQTNEEIVKALNAN